MFRLGAPRVWTPSWLCVTNEPRILRGFGCFPRGYLIPSRDTIYTQYSETSQERQVSWPRDGYMNGDRRLVRREAKFDLIEKMAAPG